MPQVLVKSKQHDYTQYIHLNPHITHPQKQIEG